MHLFVSVLSVWDAMEAEWASQDSAQPKHSYNPLEGRFKQLQGKRSRRRREVRLRGQRSQALLDERAGLVCSSQTGMLADDGRMFCVLLL